MTKQSDFFGPALRGVRANFVPGLVLQACAAALVLGYFQLPWLRDAFTQVGELKVRYGYVYSALSTSFFAGIIPYLILRLSGRYDRRRPLPEMAFFVLFWLYRGVEVDVFYRAQAAWFGDQPSVAVISKKVFVDQFIYNPLWACPTQMFVFLWKDSGFSARRMKASLQGRVLLERTMLIMMTTWAVWVPAVAVIYTLPSALQLPLCNLVACFWTLLLTFISTDSTSGSPQSAIASDETGARRNLRWGAHGPSRTRSLSARSGSPRHRAGPRARAEWGPLRVAAIGHLGRRSRLAKGVRACSPCPARGRGVPRCEHASCRGRVP